MHKLGIFAIRNTTKFECWNIKAPSSKYRDIIAEINKYKNQYVHTIRTEKEGQRCKKIKKLHLDIERSYNIRSRNNATQEIRAQH